MKKKLGLLLSIILFCGCNAGVDPDDGSKISSVSENSLCQFKNPDKGISLYEAFAMIANYYGKAKDIHYPIFGCRNSEVKEKDTTFGLLEKLNFPAETERRIEPLFIFFTEFSDGKYRFSLDTKEDPWMDGYATIDAITLQIEPRYESLDR